MTGDQDPGLAPGQRRNQPIPPIPPGPGWKHYAKRLALGATLGGVGAVIGRAIAQAFGIGV